MTPTARTDAYRFTVQSLDDPRLADLRKEVALRNRSVPWSEPHVVSWKDVPVRSRTVEEVKVHARLGKDSPNREKYRMRNGVLNTQHVRLEDGAYFDVYVHTRFRDRAVVEWDRAVGDPSPPKKPSELDVLKGRFTTRLDVLMEDATSWLDGLPPEEERDFRKFVVHRLADAINLALG